MSFNISELKIIKAHLAFMNVLMMILGIEFGLAEVALKNMKKKS